MQHSNYSHINLKQIFLTTIKTKKGLFFICNFNFSKIDNIFTVSKAKYSGEKPNKRSIKR
ncbi:hypothetical protein BpHYR1_028958 [Brachionus plicatilis]|uniref:Uncharacterized protein n=1 Tax=Brachionus plicatilis TaxID=10195 RepID=A0A3M7SG65_BRAPC|nr:hypothetical protein BpHYR1_028958 [Brachionus plicatilis]